MGDGERDREIYEADRDGERESGKKRKVGAERGLEAQEESESESKSDLRAREAASASCFVAAAGAGNALLAMAPGSNLQASQPRKQARRHCIAHTCHVQLATYHVSLSCATCHVPCRSMPCLIAQGTPWHTTSQGGITHASKIGTQATHVLCCVPYVSLTA